jgi:hypothetical protein
MTGLGRRASLKVVVSGNTAAFAYELWCGATLCQRRSSSDALARKFYPEGEFIAAGSEKYYYGPDQLGTPRVVGDPDDGVAGNKRNNNKLT